MQSRNLIPLIGVFVIAIGFLSCEKEDFDIETLISSYNSTESHKSGENCMICHKYGGPGEGIFTIAGTVYESTKTSIFPNATVKFYTSPNGSGALEVTIEVDKYGNFYTTENIDFKDGLYASVEGDLDTEYKNSPITTGECNSCHGVNTDRIWAR